MKKNIWKKVKTFLILLKLPDNLAIHPIFFLDKLRHAREEKEEMGKKSIPREKNLSKMSLNFFHINY